MLFRAREVQFWTRSVLVEGPQYSIYQKRDQNDRTNIGPDEIATDRIVE